MAHLQKTVMLWLLLCLTLLLSTGQFQEMYYCFNHKEPITAKCGEPAVIQCNGTTILSAAECTNMGLHCSWEQDTDWINSTCANERFKLTMNMSNATLNIGQTKLTDTGCYKWFLTERQSYAFYFAFLSVEGSSKSPILTLNQTETEIVCQAVGGCPVGQMQWSDNHRTNWTKSAHSEEQANTLTSFLPLLSSSIMDEYCCTVTYTLEKETKNETKCITAKSATEMKSRVDAEAKNAVLYILVPIAVLVCAMLVVLFIHRNRPRLRLIGAGRAAPAASSDEETLHLPDSP